MGGISKFFIFPHFDIIVLTFPDLFDAKVSGRENLTGPNETDDVEAEELSALVELGMLDLGQVELAINPVQKILLNDLMHNDGDQQVKENGRHVPGTSSIVDDILDLSRGNFNGNTNVMMKGDEQRGQRRRDLKHQADDKDHGNASNDVGMVLNDKFVAKHGRILGASTFHRHL